MRPSLGILITYFNERGLLRECLSSIASQRERPDAILIYDDASEFPAEDYVPKGLEVRVIHGESNRGPSHGRNRLLKTSQSDYVHFHDADDLFHPDWCLQVLQKIQETNADAIFTEISSFQNDKLVTDKVLGLKRLAREDDLIRFCIQGAILTSAGTYRRTAILAIGGYRESLWQSEDFDFHVRLAASGVRFAVIEDPLVQRMRVSGRSQDQIEVWSSALEAIEGLSKEIPKKYHQDLAEKAAQAGSILFRLGDRINARQAFTLARRLGPPSFRHRQFLYRIAAKTLGQEAAERLSSLYHNFPHEENS